jgi:hypothetical protein
MKGQGRSVFRYDWEDGGWISFAAGGNVSTEEALNMAETLIALKREEIARTPRPKTAESEPENSEAYTPVFRQR